MKKLLFLFDTDAYASVFDTVVAYDGGADRVTGYANVTPDNVGALVDGTIFTRGGKDKQSTAIFVGGGDMPKGEAVLATVKKRFFGPFRVSVMLDSNGSNTTAVAAVVKLAQSIGDVKGRRAVVVAGTGPVGTRAAGLLARDGAHVTITSRQADEAKHVTDTIKARFGGAVESIVVPDPTHVAAALGDAELLLNAGPAGVQLVPRDAWMDRPTLRVVADLNAVPPLGIEGVDVTDAGADRGGAKVFGALGIGNFKMKVHKRCIAKLFERNDLVLDAESIGDIARELVQSVPQPSSVPPPV